jgi:lipopolysaccharide transport system permease protein
VTVTANHPAAAAATRKRDLWWQFTVRSVESRYRGSYLGIIWAVLNPLLMLCIYFVVFGLIFGGHFRDPKVESLEDYAIAMFLGLTLYQLVADTICTAPLLITSNSNLVKKVVFPLEVLPMAQAGGLWFNLLIGLVLAFGGWIFIGNGLTLAGLAFFPVIVLPLLMMCMGLSWLLAGLGVFFRDLPQAMPFVAQIIMYASAVFYPVARISPGLWLYLKWNPFLQTVVLSREAVLWHLTPSYRALAYTYAAGFAAMLVGRWCFLKLRPAFADVI